MTKGFHECDRGIIVRILEKYLVRNQLVMETRPSQGLSSGELVINGVDEVLDRGRDNTTAACGTRYEEQSAIGMSYNRWCDG